MSCVIAVFEPLWYNHYSYRFYKPFSVSFRCINKSKRGIHMESKFQLVLKQALRYPILLIVSGVVALFCLISFFIQLGNLFSVAGWFGEMLTWYLRDFSSFFSNLGIIMNDGIFLIYCLFYTLQFLGTLALIALLFGLATNSLKDSKPVQIILLVAAIVASCIINPFYELFNGFPLFSSPVAFLYRFHNILPMNLAALVIVIFLFIYLKKKKAMSFTLYLFIAGGIQILFALLHIIGSLIIGGIGFGDVLIWLIDLASPVLFVFLGCMIEEKLTGNPAPYVGKIISVINKIQFTSQQS